MENFKRNISLLMDFYELTMSNGYFVKNKKDEIAVFDLFYRNNPDEAAYSIFCGLEDVINYVKDFRFDESDIDYLKSLNIFNDEFLLFLKKFKFRGDIYSFLEGSVVYPNEPLMTIVGPLIDCQLLETALLAIVNHETLIATKANRIVLAAKGRSVSDFGARRAHNIDSALYGAKAAYIGGVNSTATTLAGELFNIPVSGTMAHSWIMSFEDEYDAFLTYAKLYPENSVFLIDTYDVIHSGLMNAIKVAKEFLIPNGYKLKGVRIDSGDLAYLSKKCRKILDQNGLKDTIIVASNSLDEYKINSLIDKVIGRAAAFIAIDGNVQTVYGEMMSEDALQLLKNHKIPATYGKLVPQILNRDKSGLCPMEQTVLGIQSPDEALKLLRKKLKELK